MRYQDLYIGQHVYHTRRQFWGTVAAFDECDATILVNVEYRERLRREIYYADINLLVEGKPVKPIYLVSPIFLEEHI